MRILVTGGAGFLGSHLCGRFLAEGEQVICMDNLLTGDKKNIAGFLKNKRFKFVKHDVSQHIKLPGALDWILHFASPASPVDYAKYPIPTLKVGSLGTHNALGLARAKSAKFLLASTSEIYGDPAVSPQPESYWGNVNCIGPRGVYDEAKRFAEAITMAYHRIHGLDTRIVRIFNTYGPRMKLSDGRLIPNMLVQTVRGEPLTVYGDGKQTRSFCYVDDLVEGIVRLMNSNIHDPVNIGNPEERTILDFVKALEGLAGKRLAVKHLPLPQDDPKVRCPNITIAQKKLGWTPSVELKDGLARTLTDFRSRITS
ncbi:SDR family oxidoreductase [bacterium]|nr:SDR family oxidoreductase [bacterium]